ncbi:hypothetical protein [Paraliomyxa miuraensis]|uniref:hypothetical protein n=1 Tax=Paraliomyxa miuraensis TaxID=376150 RepID=UPI002253091F|nr:hypothetical protein [Paraliomyxa miuraensis]MCX4246257.1 hypothetical protein [Paraliomyxa miuraensis]
MPWLSLAGFALALLAAGPAPDPIPSAAPAQSATAPSAAPAQSATVSSAAPTRGQSAAERLHRKGVHCMDEIERPECAIESFEALLDEDTRQRELVTDGLLRLLTLYRRLDREDDIAPLLRRYWEAGGGRRSAGHVPYSLRYLPSELNMMINVDPPRVLASSMLQRGGDDLRDFLFTCDDALRHDVEMRQRWRRSARLAAETGRQTWEVFYEKVDAEAERDRKRKEREARRTEEERERDRPPLMMEVACPLVDALELRDNADWRRMSGIGHHRERDKNVAIFELAELETKLAAAVAAGRLLPDGPGRWRLPEQVEGFEDDGRELRLVSLDLDELLVAPQALLGPIIEASRKRKRRMNRELERLVDGVPRDTVMFMALNQAALRELGFGEMERRSLRSVLEAVLPRPKGLQIAAIVGDSAALFTRVPTDAAVRGRMLVTVANALLARSAEDDAETAKWIEDLDVAEASDRKALLMSYVLSAARLEEILWD